jgi:hydroxymethylpyrimidine/phosphomethylpyrimidine kinase
MTATTALTAQNTLGVVDIHYTPPEFVGKLIDSCIIDIGVDVVKTGWYPPPTFLKSFLKTF